MKDIFGNLKPICIEVDEWWFNGRIISKQDHPRLPKYVSFSDDDNGHFVAIHSTRKEAIDYCIQHPCYIPINKPKDYIGGI